MRFFINYFIGDNKQNNSLTIALNSRPHKIVDFMVKYYFSKQKPDFFQQYINTAMYNWDNIFKPELTSTLDAEIQLFDSKLEFMGRYSSIKNYIYIDNNREFNQYSNFNSIAFSAKAQLSLWIFNIEEKLLLQTNSNPEIVSIPQIASFTNFYFNFKFLKKRLNVHLGTQLTIHSDYYFKAYDPAIGVFYNQNELNFGRFPFVDAYLDLKYKRISVSISYKQLADVFGFRNSFTTLHYPQNTDGLHFTLAWHFYN
ncbi:MAG: hypothetical protein IPO21_09925 [Bacteroidales bacterium]|nr:hypothetical protein [Bacteroidales bacterium]